MALRALDDLIAEIATFDGDPTDEANAALMRADMVSFVIAPRLRVENREADLLAPDLVRAMDYWGAFGLPAVSEAVRKLNGYEKTASFSSSVGHSGSRRWRRPGDA